MRRALELARRGWGQVQPNPLVGAVIVRAGAVVAEGCHERYGGPHAEINALRAAGEKARGATLFVTLEPCAHHGKTPPCTDAIIEAGIAEVYYATEDPHTSAAGGAGKLRAAGVAVHVGLECTAARALNAAFFHVHEHGGPFVALKLAMSLDGRIAAAPRQRTPLTGSAAQREVHRLRSGYDAILIGRVTAEVDDPLLTVRDAPVRVPPVRIVVDTDARLDPDSRLVRTIAEAPVWLITSRHASADHLSDRGVRILRVHATSGGIDLRGALQQLAAAGIGTVFVEGGARLASALLRADLVQRMYLFIAPRFIGNDGVLAFDDAAASSRWRFTEQERCGDDVLLTLDRTELT